MAGRHHSYAKWKKKIWPSPKNKLHFFFFFCWHQPRQNGNKERNQRPTGFCFIRNTWRQYLPMRKHSSFFAKAFHANELFFFFLCTHIRVRHMIKEMKIKDKIIKIIPRVFNPYAWNIFAKYEYAGVGRGRDRYCFWVTQHPFTQPSNHAGNRTGTQTQVSHFILKVSSYKPSQVEGLWHVHNAPPQPRVDSKQAFEANKAGTLKPIAQMRKFKWGEL